MQRKICMITGANAGIGKITALELAKMGAVVIMLARDKQRGEQAYHEIRQQSGNDQVHLMLADLASLAQVRQLASDFKAQFSALHVLVNNAGIVPLTRTLSEDGYEMQFAVNHLAHFLLTNLLLDVLKNSAPARVITVSSGLHRGGNIDFDNLQSERGYSRTGAYANTKLMNVLFTYELARRLSGTGVTANVLNPGVFGSKLGDNWAGRNARERYSDSSLKQGARTSIYLASSPDVENISGKYFSDERIESAYPDDEALAKRLWDVSIQLAGL